MPQEGLRFEELFAMTGQILVILGLTQNPRPRIKSGVTIKKKSPFFPLNNKGEAES